jgi:hypothetical protein
MTIKDTPKRVAPAAANDRRLLHGKHSAQGTLTVKIENERTNLTQSEQNVLAEDRERWKRMGAGAHLDDWLAFGPGLLLRRRMAERMAHVNRPEGKGYAQAFAALLEQDGLNTMDKQSISAVLWLNDDPARMIILREIRDAMTVGERARLNSPISARQRVEKILKVREAAAKAREEGREGEPEEKLRGSPMARLKDQVAEQTREIEHLKERLAAAEQRDGSLFDLRRDKIDDIAVTIISNASPSRAEGIARALLRLLKEKKTPVG